MDQKWNTVNGFSLSEIKAHGIFFFFSFGHDSATLGLARPELLMHPALDAPISPKSLRVTEPSVEIFFFVYLLSPSGKGGQGMGAAVSASHALSAAPSWRGLPAASPAPKVLLCKPNTHRDRTLQHHNPNY